MIRVPNLFGNVDLSGFHNRDRWIVEAGRAKGAAAESIGQSIALGLNIGTQRQDRKRELAQSRSDKLEDRAYQERARQQEYDMRLQFEKDKGAHELALAIQQDAAAAESFAQQAEASGVSLAPEQQSELAAIRHGAGRVGTLAQVTGERMEKNPAQGGLSYDELLGELQRAQVEHGTLEALEREGIRKKVPVSALLPITKKKEIAAFNMEAAKGLISRREAQEKAQMESVFKQDQDAAERQERAARVPDLLAMGVSDPWVNAFLDGSATFQAAASTVKPSFDEKVDQGIEEDRRRIAAGVQAQPSKPTTPQEELDRRAFIEEGMRARGLGPKEGRGPTDEQKRGLKILYSELNREATEVDAAKEAGESLAEDRWANLESVPNDVLDLAAADPGLGPYARERIMRERRGRKPVGDEPINEVAKVRAEQKRLGRELTDDEILVLLGAGER